LLLVLVALLTFLAWLHSGDLRGTDFPDFYTASRMVAGSHGLQLYDAELQRQAQTRYAGRAGTLYIHPPFEAILYLAVAWLPMPAAYVLWCLLNLGFLAGALHTLASHALPGWNWRIVLGTSLLFVPVLLNFSQGQDSALLFLLVTVAFIAFRQNRNFVAGCWLALALFKFQLVIPVVVVLALRKGGRTLLRGFGLVALALAGLSAVITGWQVFSLYSRLLLHLQQQPFAGVFAAAMANFRGLVWLFLGDNHPTLSLAIIAALSIGALLIMLKQWKAVQSPRAFGDEATPQLDRDLVFGNTIVFAILVSYHLNPHDLTLLLLPLLLLWQALKGRQQQLRAVRWSLMGLMGILFFPPLHVLALRAHAYALVALPVCATFLTNAFLASRHEKAGV
jgi:hypothetical protein